MKDEEFKKKLETILENLYRIDREVREYLGGEKFVSETQEYLSRSSQKYNERTDQRGKGISGKYIIKHNKY